MKPTDRISWVDTVRGLCMIAILLFHTEKYYAGEEIIPYALYVDNAVMTFFFISGYLFYHPEKPFSVRHKLLSLFKSMFVPYLLFTSVIAFPKAFVHDDTTLTETLTAILTGHASWFIAALIVAELIFCGLLWLCHRRLWLLGFLCAIPYPLIAIAYRIYGETTMESMNYWCWQNALLMLLFLFSGYLCHRLRLFRFLHQRPVTVITALLIIVVKYMIFQKNVLLTIQPVHVNNYLCLFIDGILGIIGITALCRFLPRLRLIEWTGKHSIIYYFICGGVPFTVTRLLCMAGLPYEGFYPTVFLAFVLVYFFSTVVTYLILKVGSYIPTNK